MKSGKGSKDSICDFKPASLRKEARSGNKPSFTFANQREVVIDQRSRNPKGELQVGERQSPNITAQSVGKNRGFLLRNIDWDDKRFAEVHL